MSGAKIVHLTSVHKPFDVRIYLKECRTLAAAGYDVTLIAPHTHDECKDGVQMRAIPIPSGGRRERMLNTSRLVYRAALRENAQVYHFHDPELIPAGLLLKARGKRVVYDVHENVREDLLEKGYLSPAARRIAATLVGALDRLGGRAFNAIVAATPGIARRYPQRKTVVVQNFPIAQEVESLAGDPLPFSARPMVAVYVGSVHEVRGIREIVTAAGLLPQSLGARLSVAGDFMPPSLESEVRRLPGASSTDFLGWRSRTEICALLAGARAGLVTFHPQPSLVEAWPIKMFEYMAAGLPVIASDFPLWREIIQEGGFGLMVDPMDPAAIAEAMARLMTNSEEAQAMGARGRRAVLEKYNWANEGRKLLDLYRDKLLI